tara:strand:- start:3204 stop:3896 length:693 start_codon:yes stop_codon:yes gene_type:complete
MKKKIICIIPARAGSKGIKNKNMVELKGKPLIYWTIKLAKKVKYFDKIVVSTNSKKIQNYSKKNGVQAPYLRPEIISKDKTPMYKVVKDMTQHYIKNNYIPYAVAILQPTSPLRKLSTINKACQIFLKKKYDSLTTIEEIKHNHNPDYIFKNRGEFKKKVFEKLKKKKNRQNEKVFFGLDGGVIFLTKMAVLNNYLIGGNVGFLKVAMPESIDIDNINDLKICRKLDIKI